MKKIYYAAAALIIIGAAAVYLNRAYAHIYHEIGSVNLQSPDKSHAYSFDGAPSAKPLVYAAVGDSLTAGVGVGDYRQSYPYLLAQRLAGNQPVTLQDAALPGFTSADVKSRLLSQVILDKPDVVTLLIGINDIHQQVSLQDFTNNYQSILTALARQTMAKVYIVNIPYLGSSSLLLPPYNYYFDAKTRQFNAALKNLAQKNGVLYIDLYSPTRQAFAASNSYYSADQFHPSAKGYALWANIMYADFNK